MVQLVEPQRALPDLVGTTLDGKTINLRALKDQWLLVSVASGACDEGCARHLYLQRQLREGLGKDKDRLDWVWLVHDAAPVARRAAAGAQGRHGASRVPEPALARWLEPQAGHALRSTCIWSTRLGNWMMRFPPNLTRRVRSRSERDLDRLMRASVHWDKAGAEAAQSRRHARFSVRFFACGPHAFDGLAVGVWPPVDGVSAQPPRQPAGAHARAHPGHAVSDFRPGAVWRIHPPDRQRPGLPGLARLLRQCQPAGRQ